MGLNSDEIFGIVVLAVALPVYIPAIVWFYKRREIQPIKARSPFLVLVCDIVLVAYVVVTCVQRIVGTLYPCYLNLWASFVGTLVLCGTYLIRCWHLYFKYCLTQEKLSTEENRNEDNTFFIRYRKYTNVSFLTKILVAVCLLSLIPVAVLSYVHRKTLSSNGGDDCSKDWGNALLAGYVGAFVLCYLFFGWNLRQVVDAFQIKEELRYTGVVGILAVIPWFLFNNTYRSIDTDVFPFSSVVIVIAITFALFFSTAWPLYRSIFQPLALDDLNVPDDIKSLRGLLSDVDGFKSFKSFLSQEFSVENILFWHEVEDFRSKKARNLPPLEMMGEAQVIYSKYIIRGAPFEVNLPSKIVADLQQLLKKEYGNLAEEESRDHVNANDDETSLVGNEDVKVVPTIFDTAQRNIFLLMETDSYHRYCSSPEYKALTKVFTERTRKKEVLLEMQVI